MRGRSHSTAPRVVYRGSYPHPATGNELFEIPVAGLRALDNNMYVVAVLTLGTYYIDATSRHSVLTPLAVRSFIFDYRGQIVGRQEYGGFRIDLRRGCHIDVEADSDTIATTRSGTTG